ncbi:aprataxin-like protein [Recurvomyces mirabilis]|uniref:Aprataxin-like protein n=1 Tax=Recurvomyces mirabilis TaxID=574656 RepID=A0AAE0WXV9_9PEZI|nr:aprataxin-like protein [Recurvomyces mirabilis]KAK5162021.1 aprataxin-like protein [Recurvomyces mirabilis]
MASADDFDDHVEDAAVPGEQSTSHYPPSDKPNAFTELMSPKKPKQPKPTPSRTDQPTKQTIFAGRDGLAAYTTDPASFPASRVVYYNDKFVVIKDLFPKATVHLLLLPRDTSKNVQRGQEAFDDLGFLEECREKLEKVKEMAGSELRRKLGKYSAKEAPRLAALREDEPPDVLPVGRDWTADLITGTHANPSMNHLHIHVLSRDMVSECMKKSNHYLSFTTDFLIGLDEYPLAEQDHRRAYKHFPGDMLCWRCGRNFGNKMARLREHLEEELVEWRKE